ncbi:MAG TPA: C69 family dipeptidase [Spirochaetota bacterium]|nr:C69 family dipeptidase [Spirochaetota bacterium]
MCDTMVSTPRSSTDGVMLVAKNSDREPNEAQNITFVPASDHPAGSRVKCTYIEIPQVKHTYAALLSRPFWMFGAEMGVNERGVAIGNEAVFTREKYHKNNDALLGMDILRLALERSRNAIEAVEVVTGLLAAHGQGGVHTMGGTKYYHNSFIIADPSEAYVLETAGTHWAYKKVDDIASISNCLTIGDDYDRAWFGADETGRRKRKGGAVNFAGDFSDVLYTHFAKGRTRKACSYDQLERIKGSITSSDMMRILRSHNMPEPYRPGPSPMERICLHAGGLVSTQTAGSMVAALKKGRPPLVYFTGTSAPCMSVYKPHAIGMDQKKPHNAATCAVSPFGGWDLYGSATSRWDRESLWWTGESIHRRVLMNYPALMPTVRSARDETESGIVGSIEKKWKAGGGADFVGACGRYAQDLVLLNRDICDAVAREYRKLKKKKDVPWWFALQWDRINAKAGFPVEK